MKRSSGTRAPAACTIVLPFPQLSKKCRTDFAKVIFPQHLLPATLENRLSSWPPDVRIRPPTCLQPTTTDHRPLTTDHCSSCGRAFGPPLCGGIPPATPPLLPTHRAHSPPPSSLPNGFFSRPRRLKPLTTGHYSLTTEVRRPHLASGSQPVVFFLGAPRYCP